MVAGLVLLSGSTASAQPAPAPPPAPAPAPAPAELPAPPPGGEATPPAEEAAPPAEEAAPTEEPPAEEAPAEETPTEEPPAEKAAPAEDVVAPEAAEPVEEPPTYRVADEAWEAAMEQKVTVEIDDADPLHGKLVATTPAAAVVVGDDGNVHTLQKAVVASLAIDEAEPPAEEPAPVEEVPPDDEEPTKGTPDDWKKFGVFTSHGISYAHWRTSLYRAGAAAYAGDLGVGYNWSRPWGAYLVLGGHAGARLVNRTIKGNFGHLAGMMRYRGKKRFVGMFGLALAWSKLDEPTRRVRDVSVSIPLKAMATFNVAKATYIGVGIGYEPGFFAQGRIANALSFQATLAHW